MFNLGDLLKKFSNITPPNESVKNAVSESLKEILNIELDKKNIKISGNIIYLEGTPALKNTVFTNKNRLITAAMEKLNSKEIIKDIR